MKGVMKEGSIGSVLLNSQIISEDDIEKALAEQESSGCRFGEALINLGIVTQEDIDWALSYQLNIPYIRLKKELVDADSAKLIPAALARQYNLMPILRVGDELSIVMADPLNKTAIEAVEQISGCRATVSVGFIREIREMQELFYGAVAGRESLGFSSPSFSTDVLTQINDDMSGGKFFDYLLLFIIQNRLSSLSLEPLGDSISVTGKRGGASRAIGTIQVTYYPDLLLKLRKLAKINGTGESAARGGLSFRYKQKMLQFQVFMLRGMGGDLVTVRPQAAFPFPANFKELELSPAKGERLASLAAERQGLILFPLPDREERSRFLDMFMEISATAGRRVLLLGESLQVSGRWPRISLHQDPEILTAALEHDPDILVIEDITNPALFVAAFKATLGGKLVIAGIALPDLASTFELLHDYYRKQYFLPSYLKGIVTAKGVLTLCPECRESYQPTAEEVGAIGSGDGQFYLHRGCEACGQTGYRGRKYLLDVVRWDRTLLDLLEKTERRDEAETLLQQPGYCSVVQEAAELLRNGDISPGEYLSSLLH